VPIQLYIQDFLGKNVSKKVVYKYENEINAKLDLNNSDKCKKDAFTFSEHL